MTSLPSYIPAMFSKSAVILVSGVGTGEQPLSATAVSPTATHSHRNLFLATMSGSPSNTISDEMITDDRCPTDT